MVCAHRWYLSSNVTEWQLTRILVLSFCLYWKVQNREDEKRINMVFVLCRTCCWPYDACFTPVVRSAEFSLSNKLLPTRLELLLSAKRERTFPLHVYIWLSNVFWSCLSIFSNSEFSVMVIGEFHQIDDQHVFAVKPNATATSWTDGNYAITNKQKWINKFECDEHCVCD